MDSGGWTVPRRSRERSIEDGHLQPMDMPTNGRRMAWGRLVGARVPPSQQDSRTKTRTFSRPNPTKDGRQGYPDDLVFVSQNQADTSTKRVPSRSILSSGKNAPQLSESGPLELPKEVKSDVSTTPALSIAATTDWNIVHFNSTIAEVCRAFEGSPYVLVREDGKGQEDFRVTAKDIVLSRIPFLKCAMAAESIKQPLSSIIHKVPTVKAMQAKDTLNSVLSAMLSSGREEVCIVDGDNLRGIITSQDILLRLRNPQGTGRRRSVLFTNASEYGASTEVSQHRSAWADSSMGNTSQFHATSVIGEGYDDSEDLEIQTKTESRAHRVDRDNFSKTQKDAQQFCTSWCSELMIGSFVILDTAIGFAAYVTGLEGSKAAVVAMCCIVTLFVYERTLRTFGFGLDMLRHPFWIFDCLIVDFSALAAMLLLTEAISASNKNTLIIIRVLRMLRAFLIIRNLNLTIKLRRAVSSQKTRFREDGFDLDLTYVTKYCIAMSVPGLGTAEASYRNPLSEVQRFFQKRHFNHYLIFNLCKERDYDPALFEGQVIRIPVEDHNPPFLSQVLEFLDAAGDFMEKDELNCIAVHCKGGKGRTGTMICAWLMYSHFRKTATDAMAWFEQARTGKKAKASQGVSQPSQQRYVRYTEQVLAAGGHHAPELLLRRIVLRTCPRVDADGGCKPWFVIEATGRVVFDYKQVIGEDGLRAMGRDEPSMSFEVNAPLTADVRIIFFDHDDAHDSSEFCGLRQHHYVAADDLRFFFWFHTGFVTSEVTVLNKTDVDIACHDRKCKVFLDTFAVELHFDRVPDPATATSAELGPFITVRRPSPQLLQRSNTRRKVEVEAPYVLPKGSRLESMQETYLARKGSLVERKESLELLDPMDPPAKV